MKRALLIVLDSVGIGHAPDAAEFGDAGADTVGHILENRPQTALPNLDRCGLAATRSLAAGGDVAQAAAETDPAWAFAALREISAGKDTTTGHWEIAAEPLAEPFAVYDRFPPEIVARLERETGFTFIGNYARSGTVILDELGAEHVRSGHPILYTSADSVMQIAAHEDTIPLEELYHICRVARGIADELRIGRVIARPFTGQTGAFKRTPNRRDFSLIPPPTVLTALAKRGIPVLAVGKISDIFAGEGITASHPTKSNAQGMETIDRLWDDPEGGTRLIFVNLVDFDMYYGHRRDVEGYARALEECDRWLGRMSPRIGPDDLVVITADHGNDPTWTGTDHTREMVPLLLHAPGVTGSLGIRPGFSCIAATLADWFGLGPWRAGESLLR